MAKNARHKRPSTVEKIQRTAYHEAGHAVMCVKMRIPFRKVTIVPDGDSVGKVLLGPWYKKIENDCESTPIKTMVDRIERTIMVLLAGIASEATFTNRRDLHEAHDDRVWATRLAWRRHKDKEFENVGKEVVDAYVEYMYLRTRSMFDDPLVSEPVVALTKALLEKGTLNSRLARRVMSSGKKAWWLKEVVITQDGKRIKID